MALDGVTLSTTRGCQDRWNSPGLHRQATPRDQGLPTPVCLCSKPTPRPGSWVTRGLFHQKPQKTAQGPVLATTRPQHAVLFKCPTQPLTGTTSPRERGEGCRPAGPVHGHLVLRGPQNRCSRTPFSRQPDQAQVLRAEASAQTRGPALSWKIRTPGSHRRKLHAVTWWPGWLKRSTLHCLHTWKHGWQWAHM